MSEPTPAPHGGDTRTFRVVDEDGDWYETVGDPCEAADRLREQLAAANALSVADHLATEFAEEENDRLQAELAAANERAETAEARLSDLEAQARLDLRAVTDFLVATERVDLNPPKPFDPNDRQGRAQYRLRNHFLGRIQAAIYADSSYAARPALDGDAPDAAADGHGATETDREGPA